MQAGAPVGARDSDGNTALHYAAKMGHVGIVNILLINDAAATAVNETGWSPLMMACKHAYSLSTVVALVAGGAHINKRDYYGKSALHYAFEAYKESYTMKQFVGSAKLISKVLETVETRPADRWKTAGINNQARRDASDKWQRALVPVGRTDSNIHSTWVHILQQSKRSILEEECEFSQC